MPHQERIIISGSSSSSQSNSRPSHETPFSSTSTSTKSALSISHRPLQYKPLLNANNVINSLTKITAVFSKNSIDPDTDSDEDDYLSEEQAYVRALKEQKTLKPYTRICRTRFRTTNSKNFPDYFPTSRLMTIRHDTWMSDGHMNLRVETDHLKYHGSIQLFHLRIVDLDKRYFSLSRYERASGREVCKTTRRYVPSTPMFPRSLSAALANMKLSSPDPKICPLSFLPSRLRRNGMSQKAKSRPNQTFGVDDSTNLVITNVIKLDFSNYAQVWVERCETRLSKRYDFEYWGHEYFWKRRVLKSGARNRVASYYLYRTDYILALAQMIPVDSSERQKIEQIQKGYWIPPYNLRITQKTMKDNYCDVADVIVATGLVVLIDDTIESYRNNPYLW